MSEQLSPAVAEEAARRMVGFVNHLRLNGFVVGLPEAEAAIRLVASRDIADVEGTRLGLRCLLAKHKEEWEGFDDLFEAFWHGRGRVRQRLETARSARTQRSVRPILWTRHLQGEGDTGELTGRMEEGGGEGDAEAGEGRLIASTQGSRLTKDLRHLADRDEIAAAERTALRLGLAMRYRLSRRYRLHQVASKIDLRRTLRRSLAKGGEPIDLAWRARPEEPVRIVVLLDVSGSMELYSRFFLQFVKGLVTTWIRADAYLFHTRLLRITDALRERDPLKAMGRLSLLAAGFGGGTKIGECLATFNRHHAKRALNGRSVVLILSDGYDTGTAEHLAGELRRLKKRAGRLVWLNPLLGWRDYQPVTRAMAAALPLLDHFATAHSLESLAALEPQLARL